MQTAPHFLFEYGAYISAVLIAMLSRKKIQDIQPFPISEKQTTIYLITIWVGALSGAFIIGTINTSLSGYPMYGKSIAGALLGGIIMAELFKYFAGVRGSTGLIFVIPLAFGIAIGRIGCFFGGLEDFTYGLPTNLMLGYDFGDGISRHPVQLYESISMFLFLALFLWALKSNQLWIISNAFYIFIFYYAFQRFIWEFNKPYALIVGPFNTFHIVCVLLMVYSAVAVLWDNRDV